MKRLLNSQLNIAYRKFNYVYFSSWRKCVDLLALSFERLNIAFSKFNPARIVLGAVIPAYAPESSSPLTQIKSGCRIRARAGRDPVSGMTSILLTAMVITGCASDEALFARYDALCHQGVCVAARPTEVFYTPEISLTWEPAVYFGYDLDYMQESEISRVDRNIEFLNRYQDLKISLQGFTDSNASSKYNLALSERRVESVRDYLMQNGVTEDRIFASRGGESLPINTGNSIEDKIINRRVEMMLLDASGRPLTVGMNPNVSADDFTPPTPDRKQK